MVRLVRNPPLHNRGNKMPADSRFIAGRYLTGGGHREKTLRMDVRVLFCSGRVGMVCVRPERGQGAAVDWGFGRLSVDWGPSTSRFAAVDGAETDRRDGVARCGVGEWTDSAAIVEVSERNSSSRLGAILDRCAVGTVCRAVQYDLRVAQIKAYRGRDTGRHRRTGIVSCRGSPGRAEICTAVARGGRSRDGLGLSLPLIARLSNHWDGVRVRFGR